MNDASNGYDGIAAEFIAGRGNRETRERAVGVRIVRAWTETVKPGGTALDLGCGPGDPITRLLFHAGLTVYAVDASPRMVAEFRTRFPEASVECNTVEGSNFFGREFDAVIAWGLLFLLEPEVQMQLIEKVARALSPNGQFLFTAPRDPCEWNDAMTGQPSVSLGAETYRRLLKISGLTLLDETEDEGENHYYVALKPR